MISRLLDVPVLDGLLRGKFSESGEFLLSLLEACGCICQVALEQVAIALALVVREL